MLIKTSMSRKLQEEKRKSLRKTEKKKLEDIYFLQEKIEGDHLRDTPQKNNQDKSGT